MELARGPLPANRNLLLNYATPSAITSLFRSLLAGHFAVCLGICGSIILKALIILSTGLLTSEVKQLGYDAELRLVDQFNLSLHAGNPFASLTDSGVTLWAITQGGVPYRPGATAEHAALSLTAIDMGTIFYTQVFRCSHELWLTSVQIWGRTLPSRPIFQSSTSTKNVQPSLGLTRPILEAAAGSRSPISCPKLISTNYRRFVSWSRCPSIRTRILP
jgi:hypothetical protein